MECIFLNAAGQTLFTRSDMESGHWVQQEMSVNADFPFVPDKVIQIGQRIAFRDPATDNLEVFEIRNVINTPADQYQQITAEHIAVAELSDEHINNKEITNKTAAQALATALSGTLWSVGTNTASGTQSVDISRGSVWNAVIAIQQNWNVYITPRVVISAAGAITGRFLDIAPAQGTFRGLRLSIRKNLLDPAVTYDDTEVLTALYGYGGNVDVATSGQDDTTEELTFRDVTWTATSSHPAKPAGQTYLEWPEKTAIYGRNGRPRFGYYQNGNIEDANILLQKTWESLKKSADPKIGIAGTCVDLYRMGYKDQPLRLHDIAVVEIEETGELFNKEIITLDVDLVDPSGSRPEIGDYIPNIVYINRETNSYATTGKSGGGGGGGGGRSSGSDTNLYDTYAQFDKKTDKYGSMIGMTVGTRNGGYYIKAGQIVLAINKSGETGEYESSAFINAAHVNISATNDIHTLAGDVEHDSNGRLVIKNAAGMYVKKTESGHTSYFGVFDDSNLTAGVIATKVNGVPSTYIQGENIYIGNEKSTTVIAGKCTLEDVSATYITSKLVNANISNVASLAAGDILCDSFSLKGALQNVFVSSTSGGRIELTLVPVSGSNRTINFNIADTQYYIDGVSAARTNGYNQGKRDYQPDYISQNTSNKTVTVYNAAGDTIGGPYSASEIYTKGLTDGRGEFTHYMQVELYRRTGTNTYTSAGNHNWYYK